ncbi:Hypp4949 [Branchiostoma lanceolatum]|uniref:Hypp4949 protein n=1 Tax=Branchiostoma lanceolatum TaxID=7740 RepID=A0A8K0ACH9_BRALA|nr:Hypp4949 [Branchiostoma lanceolatum]
MAKVLLVAALLCLGLVYVRGLTNEELAALLTGAVGLGNLDIVPDPENSDYFIVSSHGMPNHTLGPWGDGNTITPSYVDHSYRIPKNPTIQAEPSCTPMGAIGLALSGAAIFNPFTWGCYDAGILEAEGFDECRGHPSPFGEYHYHIIPTCIFDVTEVPSPIIGVALDGFPIYGPTDETGRALTSADLDECHGRQVNGQYRYHVTSDFPYFLGCFKGAPVDAQITGEPCECTERADPCQAVNGNEPPQGDAPGQLPFDRDQLAALGIICPTDSPNDVINDHGHGQHGNGSGSKSTVSGAMLVLLTAISINMKL